MIVDWLPQFGATGEEILPQEGLPEEENPPKEEKRKGRLAGTERASNAPGGPAVALLPWR